MMVRFCLSLFILFAGYAVSAQSVIIAEDVRGMDEEKQYGMNRRHFSHSWIGIGFAAGPPGDPGADIHYWRSRSLEYGYRYKRQYSNVFSNGAELIIRRSAYHLRQRDEKSVPGPTIHEWEKLVFFQTGIGLYQRINVDQRGDYIGRFIDLGGYAKWNFHVRHVTLDEYDDGERVRVRRTGMNYPETFDYGVLVRLGLNSIVFKGTYRISGMFRDSANLPDLPKLTFGVEIGLHPF